MARDKSGFSLSVSSCVLFIEANEDCLNRKSFTGVFVMLGYAVAFVNAALGNDNL